MNRADYAFHPLSWEEYQAIINTGTMPGFSSPMLNRADYDSLITVMQAADIDPRLPLAFTWSEGHHGSDPGLVAARVNNLGGVKFSGAPGTTDSGIPADTGGTYAAFPDLTNYWREWVRIMNNSIIGPDFKSGNLIGAVEHYTNGPGTGHNKVTQFLAYVRDYPPGGATPVAEGVYGEDLIAILAGHENETNSDGTLDPWNAPHPWAGWCQASVEGTRSFAGLEVVHRVSAADQLDAVIAQGLLQQGRPEHGGICMWGRSFDPSGHTCFWDEDRGAFLSTLYSPSRIGYYFSDSWYAAMAGWWRAPGVLAARRGVQPSPPSPVVFTWFIDGNPYGKIPVKMPFWGKWDALNTMGQPLDHAGAVNPKGQALPILGYPMEPETTLPTGRRIQKFERAWLSVDKGEDPFDCVVLLLSERPQ